MGNALMKWEYAQKTSFRCLPLKSNKPATKISLICMMMLMSKIVYHQKVNRDQKQKRRKRKRIDLKNGQDKLQKKNEGKKKRKNIRLKKKKMKQILKSNIYKTI